MANRMMVDYGADPINIEGTVRKKKKPRPDIMKKMKEQEPISMKKDNIVPPPKVETPYDVKRQELPHPPTASPESVEQEVTREPASSNWDWGDLMVGAAPVLAGYLSGAPDIGYQMGGKGLVDRYQNEVDLNNARIKALRSQSSRSDKGRFQARPYERDGQTYIGTFDTATGQLIEGEDDPLAGYKQTYRTDPTTDEISMLSGAGGVKEIRGARPGKRTVKEEKELRNLRDDLVKDPKFKKARQVYSDSQRAIALLELNNPVADEGIKTIFPRMFGEVGNLSAQEQQRFGGSRALMDTLSRIGQRLETGNLTYDDRMYLKEVAQAMGLYAKSNLNTSAQTYMQSEKGVSDLDTSAVVEPFLNEQAPEPSGVARGAKKSTKRKPKRAIQNGWIYELQTNGEMKPIRKVRDE